MMRSDYMVHASNGRYYAALFSNFRRALVDARLKPAEGYGAWRIVRKADGVVIAQSKNVRLYG